MASRLMKFLGISDSEQVKKEPKVPVEPPKETFYETGKKAKGAVQENIRRKKEALKMLED